MHADVTVEPPGIGNGKHGFQQSLQLWSLPMDSRLKHHRMDLGEPLASACILSPGHSSSTPRPISFPNASRHRVLTTDSQEIPPPPHDHHLSRPGLPTAPGRQGSGSALPTLAGAAM